MTHAGFFVLFVTMIAMVPQLASAQEDSCSRDHEVYTTCGSSCPPVCNPPTPPHSCPAICIVGCQCEKGYYRRSDGACVRKCDCDV